MSKAAVDLAAARIAEAARQQAGPLIVAIDGRSGTGKSTLAKALARRLPAVVIEGDDFYAGGTQILGDPAAARAARCIDWQAQRPVLSALRQDHPARYHAFAWKALTARWHERRPGSTRRRSSFWKGSTPPDPNCATCFTFASLSVFPRRSVRPA